MPKPRLRSLLCPLILLLLAPPCLSPLAAGVPDVLTHPEAIARAARVSQVSYRIALALAAGSDRYRGDVTIAFTLAGAGPLRLDFKPTRVRSFRINGRDWSPPAAPTGTTTGAAATAAPATTAPAPATASTTGATTTATTTATTAAPPAATTVPTPVVTPAHGSPSPAAPSPGAASSTAATPSTTALTYTHLDLPAALLATGPNTIQVEYENEYDRSGSGFHRFDDPVDGAEYLYSDFEPFYAHRLYPCFDQPDLKAVHRLVVTAPAAWKVVSNTPSVGDVYERPGTITRHEFAPTKPLSTYLFFVGAGPFAVFTDPAAPVPTRIFCRASMARWLRAPEIFDTSRRGLAFYRDYYGIAYPFEKYDHLFVPEFESGAMENPGSITYNERYLTRHSPTRLERLDLASVILHEMAHQWFGDLVTMRWWDGLWLNESFATYMAALALTRATEHTDAFAEFLQAEKSRAYRADQLSTTHPVAGTVADTDTAFANFDGITYGKGASLLKQLAFFMGEPAFRQGLGAYLAAHAWGNTEIEDFFGAMAKAGKRDLTSWRKVHLETSGVNTLRPVLVVAGGQLGSLVLEQSRGNGHGSYRPQRVQVGLYALANGKLERTRTIPVDYDGPTTPVPLPAGLPAPALVWPNEGDFAYVRAFLDPASVSFVREHLEQITDPLTRRGVWLTLWEMVRDGVLAPTSYLEVFVTKGRLEKDIMLRSALSKGVTRTLAIYLSDADLATWADRVHDVAFAELSSSAPGSDAQKTWFDLAVASARGPAALGRLEALLDARTAFPGLELSPERRWAMVTRLAVHGRPGSRERIAAERKRDATDWGEKGALQAEASLPDPAVKAAVWERCLTDTKSSLDQLRARMAGFHQRSQVELSRPYVDRFFAAIPGLVAHREQEFVDAFADGLYPAFVPDPAVVATTRAFLEAHPALPDDIRKSLADEADELARALRIRKIGGPPASSPAPSPGPAGR